MSEISNKLNLLLADSAVLFTKLHNYHWNIQGVQFFGIHQKTEELYEYVSTMYDDLAERNLQIGGTPLVSLKQYLEKARISEDEKTDFNAKYVVEKIAADFEFLVKEFKELSEMSENDPVTAAYADDQTAFFEKQIWMLKAFLG